MYLKSCYCNGRRKLEAFVSEKQLLPSSYACTVFHIQILVNSKIFNLSLNIFLTHLRAQIACYELKGDLSPVMLKEIFHESFKNFETTRICVENHTLAWLDGKSCFSHHVQMLLTFGGLCNRYFWDIRLKMVRLPNFNMLFQLVLRKFFKSELSSYLPKVDHVIKSCKEPSC